MFFGQVKSDIIYCVVFWQLLLWLSLLVNWVFGEMVFDVECEIYFLQCLFCLQGEVYCCYDLCICRMLSFCIVDFVFDVECFICWMNDLCVEYFWE